MNIPPFLTGASLIFWGIQTGNLWLGVAVGFFFEIGRLLDWKWDLTEKEYCRIWDLCAVLFAGSAVYFYTSESLTSSAYSFFQWLPITLLPMLAAQWFGPREKIPYRVFACMLLRRKKELNPERWQININYIFFTIVLVGISAINSQKLWFFAGFAFLCSWALWSIRPRRLPAWSWALLLLISTSGGYLMHTQVACAAKHT